MSLVTYAVDEHVATVTLNDGENRFNPNFLNALLTVLDDIEQRTPATALVVTSSHEKIFSNGIDLDWLVPVIQRDDIALAKDFFYLLNRLFKRIVTYPLITVGAISGHAFALGAIICGAFDFRFMRSDRGYFCLPAIDLGLPFLPSMIELLRKAIPRYKLEEMILTGTRLTAEECEAHHIVQKAYPQEILLESATDYAKTLNKKRDIVGEMKARFNKDILYAIEVEDIPYINAGMKNFVM